jgi:transposase
MLEAILYNLRVACPWSDLPQSFGPWSSVYTRWRRWTLSGTWDQILEILKNDAVGALTFLDSTHVKVHQVATNAV